MITDKERMRMQVARLEVYKQAVKDGFYNEAPGTVSYKGYLLMQDGHHWLVMEHGQSLIQLTSLHVAKVWVTCRVNNCGLVDANRIVKVENLG